MMKKFLTPPLVVAVLMILLLAVYVVSNPLRRSDNYLRGRFLNDTPIGTSMNDVISYIRKKEYRIVNISDSGFPDKNSKYVGYRSIRVDLGDYNTILTTNVTVFWGFDEESKLIDVRVWKTVDAL